MSLKILPQDNLSSPLFNNSNDGIRVGMISEVHAIIWWVVNTLGSVTGSIGTFAVLIVLLTARRLRSKTTTLITSLMVSDFLMSLILQSARADFYNIYFTLSMYDSGFVMVVAALCYLSSMGNILAVSLERYFAVVFPFKYTRLITKKIIMLAIAVVWISSATVAIALHKLNSPNNLERRVFDIIAISTFTLVLLALIVIYGQIFYIVAKQRRKFSQQLSHIVQWEKETSNTQIIIKDIKNNIRTDKSTTIVSLLALMFVFLWLPTWIFVVIKEIFWFNRLTDPRIVIAEHYLISIHLWNSSINWYIYCWKSSEFRAEFDILAKKLYNFLNCRILK